MSTHQQFVAEVDAYLNATRMTATAFGLAALSDGKFVFELRSGARSPTLRTIERVRDWIDANPPRALADSDPSERAGEAA